MIASLVAGTRFGTTFLWAILVGAVVKFALSEGVGRWHLATGQTILGGWHALGRWATGYFAVYAVIWGVVFGAAASSACGLGLAALFGTLPLWAWAILNSLLGLALVWTGRYALFENVMKVLVGLMFVTMIGSAILVLPSIGELASGLVPRVPDGSLLYALGLAGGVGGTITLASYGYWLREKRWRGSSWIPTMRTDALVAYTITSLFVIAMLLIGAGFLFGTNASIEGEEGLVSLANLMGEEIGEPVRILFLVGFWAAAFTSLLGVWNGVPYLFADFVRILRRGGEAADADEEPVSEKSWPYRAYLLWLTFPPMLLLFFQQPVGLVLVYAALGALFMPFLAITLLLLLNSRRVEPGYRNGLVTNVVLVGCVLLFAVLAVQELIGVLTGG
jgi:Mn2+/Fe2+ NRAMP family transporter